MPRYKVVLFLEHERNSGYKSFIPGARTTHIDSRNQTQVYWVQYHCLQQSALHIFQTSKVLAKNKLDTLQNYCSPLTLQTQ